MSKFCFNCGTQLGDADMFCQNCGAKQNQAPQTPHTEPTPKPASKLPFNLSKNSLIGIGGVLAVILVVVIIISSLTSSSYKDPIDLMVDVTMRGKIEKLEKLAPKDYWEYYEEEYEMSVKDIIKEYKENDYLDEMMESLEEMYGKNIKISYKITDKEKLDKDELDQIKDGLKENYGIAKKSVKKGYELEVEMTIKGKEDKDTDDEEVIVVQIGKKWYVVNSNGTISVGF